MSSITNSTSEKDPLKTSIHKFTKTSRKLRERENRYRSKPEKYSWVNRALRLGATMGVYSGFVALKNNLFPINGSPSSGYVIFGFGQIGILLAGVRMTYADNYRKGKINKLKWKNSTAKNNLSREISRTSADKFFRLLIEQASDDFEKIFSTKNLSKREKRKIKQSFNGIKDAVAYFSGGFYTGSVDLDQLDLFKKRIIDLEEACYQAGIDVEDSKREIIDGIKKVRRDEIGEEPDFIDTVGFERENPFQLKRITIANGENTKPQLGAARQTKFDPPSRGLGS